MPEGTFVGTVEDSDAFVAVVSDGDGEAVVYVCDGANGVAILFKPVDDAGARFASASGAKAVLDGGDGTPAGKVQLPDGTLHAFSTEPADAAAGAGFYRSAIAVDGEAETTAGWIVLNDGASRGAVRVTEDGSILPMELDVRSDDAVVVFDAAVLTTLAGSFSIRQLQALAGGIQLVDRSRLPLQRAVVVPADEKPADGPQPVPFGLVVSEVDPQSSRKDFVEIRNSSPVVVSLAEVELRYADANSVFHSQRLDEQGFEVLDPGEVLVVHGLVPYLAGVNEIQTQPQDLPDDSGGVGLWHPQLQNFIDSFAWGPPPNLNSIGEGTAFPTGDGPSAAFARIADTNDNATDFDLVAPSPGF